MDSIVSRSIRRSRFVVDHEFKPRPPIRRRGRRVGRTGKRVIDVDDVARGEEEVVKRGMRKIAEGGRGSGSEGVDVHVRDVSKDMRSEEVVLTRLRKISKDKRSKGSNDEDLKKSNMDGTSALHTILKNSNSNVRLRKISNEKRNGVLMIDPSATTTRATSTRPLHKVFLENKTSWKQILSSPLPPPPPFVMPPTKPKSPTCHRISPPPSVRPPRTPPSHKLSASNESTLKTNPWRRGVVDLLMSMSSSSSSSPTTPTRDLHNKSGKELFHAAMLASTTSQSVLPTRIWQSESYLRNVSRKISTLMTKCVDRRSFLRRFRTIKNDLKSVILPPSVKISESQICKDLLREKFRINGKIFDSHLYSKSIEPLIQELKHVLKRKRGTDKEISRVLEAMSRTNSGGTMYEKLCLIFGTRHEECKFVVLQGKNTPRATEISIERDYIVVDTFHDFYVEFLGDISSSSEETTSSSEEDNPVTWRVLICARVMELVASSPFTNYNSSGSPTVQIRGRRVLRVDVASSTTSTCLSQDLENLLIDN